MEYVDAEDCFQQDIRTDAEKWLDAELEARGANEQGAEPAIFLRRIALELFEELDGFKKAALTQENRE